MPEDMWPFRNEPIGNSLFVGNSGKDFTKMCHNTRGRQRFFAGIGHCLTLCGISRGDGPGNAVRGDG